ncbi:uncharacterized protein F4807DRAFT_409651 [Annulohypoxylon truncatum]|uniref:uncharacterized protein n=1 Tax=Annulohypoxylon truncatum TaxID=327061 RepID=UPI0020080CB9|nr:uncharacterized protein F4807DRAFT_409651 [Annulohypoxylon truncatum]KAI1213907.1 hypothetical protein F4807DRAFT_409651 [Annulohypoxylon truncatum]
MHVLRTRVACVARRSRPTSLRISRSYASSNGPDDHGNELKDTLGGDHGDHGHDSHGHDHHHDHHHAPEVPEGLGTGFYVFAAAAPLAFLGYQVTRPGADGEPSTATTWLRKFDYFNDYEERNALRTNLLDQASHDKHLFMYAGKNPHIELKMPELIDSGSPWNVPAGFYPNLSHVTEHYRKQAAEEEERKFKKLQLLAAKAEAEAEQKKEAAA